jgi:uncharacterized damage-inducible protein DinB
MRYVDRLLAEFEHEVARTREVLLLVPDELLDWKAREGMMTIGWNANHLAEIADWIAGIFDYDVWDIAPPGEEEYVPPRLTKANEIVELFDSNVERARSAFSKAKDESIDDPWTLARTGVPLFTMSRNSVLRNFGLSHMVHHRAILRVYLRLNGIEVPEAYVPG